jgi:predicted dehydrogenase
VLVVGAGSIGERHLRCFRETGRADVSFVEIQEPLRSTIAARYAVRGFASLDEALSNDLSSTTRSRVAVIATPANSHLEIAARLAAAGWHLLIEKPLDTRLDGLAPLRAAVRNSDVVVGVAYVYRCFPALAAMRGALVEGRFGRPVQLVAVCGQNFPTYRPAYRDTYYTRHATGGGAIQDALTHVLNAGEWLVGPIDRLVADAAHRVLEGSLSASEAAGLEPVEDTVHLLARHGHVLASYALNQHQAPNETSITVVCERGTVRWEAHTQRWKWMLRPDEPWREEAFEARPRDAAFIDQANRFLDAVEGECPPLCSLDEAEQTLRVSLAALESVRSGGWRTIARNDTSQSIDPPTGGAAHA